MLTLRLLMPVTDLGPVTRTKLLSARSTMTHFLPASLPTTFTHILPISIAGKFLFSFQTLYEPLEGI